MPCEEGKYKREIVFMPAYDKRAEGCGQHCAEQRWYLHGPKGVVQFVLYTGWYPSTIATPDTKWDALHGSLQNSPWDWMNKPMPADLGYHSPVPHYEGQPPMEKCSMLPGGMCYYDGSGLNANRIFSILVHEGGEAVWKALEEYYVETFELHEVEAQEGV